MVVRRVVCVVLGAVLFIAPRVFAQEEFKQFRSQEDRFSANFPGTPVVATITWETEYGAKIPARVYSVTAPGPRRYSVTVIDYHPVQKILTDQVKACFQTDERCTGNAMPLSYTGEGYWKNDVRGAMVYAASKYIQNGDNKVTHYGWDFLGDQAIENNELMFVNMKDKSRTFVNIMMHHDVLYVMEETTPVGAPPPGVFVQSMTLRESDGTYARHYGVYSNVTTIDPIEAETCSVIGPLPDGPRGAGEGGAPANAADRASRSRVNSCEALPAAVKFQQGPNFKYTTKFANEAPGTPGGPPAAEPAGAPAPVEQNKKQ